MTTKTMTNDIDTLLDLDDAMARLEEQRDIVYARILSRMALGDKVETDRAKVAKTAGTVFVADVDTLKDNVSRTWFGRLTSRVFDSANYRRLFEAGVVPETVQAFVTLKEKAPYLSITRK